MPKQLIKTDGYKILVKNIQAELSDLEFFVLEKGSERILNDSGLALIKRTVN